MTYMTTLGVESRTALNVACVGFGLLGLKGVMEGGLGWRNVSRVEKEEAASADRPDCCEIVDWCLVEKDSGKRVEG